MRCADGALTQKHRQFARLRNGNAAVGNCSIDAKPVRIRQQCLHDPWQWIVSANVANAQMQHVIHVFGQCGRCHVVRPISAILQLEAKYYRERGRYLECYKVRTFAYTLANIKAQTALLDRISPHGVGDWSLSRSNWPSSLSKYSFSAAEMNGCAAGLS